MNRLEKKAAYNRRPESLAKKRAYKKTSHAKRLRVIRDKKYKASPEEMFKDKARRAVFSAIKTGKLIRPKNCELCGSPDLPLSNGATGLRADHYKGYEKENHLTVRFLCVKCDCLQLRKHKHIVYEDKNTSVLRSNIY